jgi:hypothetical protein
MATTPAATAPAASAEPELRVKRSAVRVVVLLIVSLGLYNLYWFYVTRKQLNAELGEERSLPQYGPGLQTFAPLLIAAVGVPISIVLMFFIVGFLLLPLVLIGAIVASVVAWYFLLKDISTLRVREGLGEISPGLYILGYIALNFVSVGVAMNGVVAYNLNEYWDKKTGGRAKEAPYTGGEIAVSVAGAVLFVLMFVAIFVLGIIGAIAEEEARKEYGFGNSRYTASPAVTSTPAVRDAALDEAYNRIQNGMTREQVRAIFNREPDSTSESTYESWTYYFGSRSINVTFTNGVVDSKSKY